MKLTDELKGNLIHLFNTSAENADKYLYLMDKAEASGNMHNTNADKWSAYSSHHSYHMGEQNAIIETLRTLGFKLLVNDEGRGYSIVEQTAIE